MYRFLFKYSFKIIARNKSVIFWLLLFPFFLSSMFGLVFKNIGKDSNISEIPVMAENKYYSDILDNFEYEGKKLFVVKKFYNPNKALKNKEIIGYLNSKNEVIISQNDIETSIFYNTVNHINYIGQSIGVVVKDTRDPRNIDIIMDIVKKDIKLNDGLKIKEKELVTIFFFGLLGMICLGGSSFGLSLSEEKNIGNSKFCVKRLHTSALNMKKLILVKFILYTLISVSISMILFAYMKYILDVNFGNHIFKTIIGIVLGNVLSILFGTLLGLLLKTSFDAKQGINASLYVFSSAISGMMVSSVAGFITNNIPIVNYINPGTLITRLFLSVYLDSNDFYHRQLINIAVVIIILTALIGILIRRKNYEHF